MENRQGVRHFIALWLLCFLMSCCIRSEVSAQTATNKVIFLDSIRHHLEPQPLPPLDSLSLTPDLPVTPYPDNSLLDSLRRLHSGYWGGSYTPQSILPQKLEKSDNVGTPHGALSISPLGAAVYDVDIKVPNGGKLTPTIGLRYNSQMSGYGLAGYGTELTGFSSITRGMRNLFINGIQKGLAYSPNENLYLDGKRLILESGEAGKEGAIYVLEGDPYTRVTEHGDYRRRGTSTWFEVRTKDGTTYEYGHDNMTRITYLIQHGSRGVIAWYVNKVSDRYDNYMIYTYSVDSYSIRPNMICYGMNSRTGKEGDYRIIFKYETLDTNKRTFRVKQYQGERNFCLSNITTYVKNAIHRSYDLTYSHDLDKSYGKWTRLTSVIEKNGKGEALRPISLQWAGLPNLVPQVHQLDVSMDDSGAWIKSSGEKSLFAVGVTGDGISDIMRIVPVTTITSVSSNSVSESYYTYLFVNRSKISSDGQISYEAPLIYPLPPSLSDNTHSVLFNGYSVMDFDGDGYNDILIPFEEDFAHAASRTKFYFILGADIVAGKQKTSYYTILPKPKVDVNPLYTTFDVDGNGKDDLVYVVKEDQGDKYWCCLVRNEGGDYSSASSFQLQLSDKPQRLFSADYNNDGLTDMLFLCQNGYKIFFNKGGKASDVHFSDDRSFVGNDLSNFWRIEQGDFDGDGLLDFVYNKTHERILYVAFNLGSGTFKHVPTGDLGLADHNSGKDDDRFAIRVVDIDHDGRSDVMVCKAGYVYRGISQV